jgi:hypothetical protein
MLNIPQIEALRQTDPQLYESLKRLAAASLGPNQGWSLDDQITDGTNFARVAAGALTQGQVDPAKSGVLMKGSVPPTWSGSFTYVSTTSSITWSWTSLAIYRADGSTTAVSNSSLTISGLTAGTSYYFYPYWDETLSAIIWVGGKRFAGKRSECENKRGGTTASRPGPNSSFAGRHDCSHHDFWYRWRIWRRKWELLARRHGCSIEGARSHPYRSMQNRGSTSLSGSRPRWHLD